MMGYAFFLLTVLLANQADSLVVTIQDLSAEPLEGIPVIFDEVGENTYYLNRYIPWLLDDRQAGAVKFDGSSALPLGSFYIPYTIPVSKRDTIKNISQLDYRKGDYDYFELGLGQQVETNDSTRFHFQAFKRNMPIIYQSSFSSNNLQNYLFSVKKKSNFGDFLVSSYYHLEAYNLPVNTALNGREVESFHSGVQYRGRWDKVKLKIHPALQEQQVNWAGTATHEQIYWNDIQGVWSLRENFAIIFDYSYKGANLELNEEVYAQDYHFSHLTSEVSVNNFNVQLGGAIAGETVEPTTDIQWTGSAFTIGLQRTIKPYFLQNSFYQKQVEHITINRMYINRISEYYKVILEVYQGKNSSTNLTGSLTEISVQAPWISTYNQFGFYFDNGNSSLPISAFAASNIFISPNTWFWQDARYQPFLQFETTFLSHRGDYGFDPLSPAFIISTEDTPSKTWLINAEIGFLVKGFRISYRWVKFNLLDEVQNSTHPDAYNIVPLRYLNISWQFLN